MTTPERSLRQQATDLLTSVDSLDKAVDGLSTRVDTHQLAISTTVRRLKRVVSCTVAGLLLLLGVVGFGVELYVQQRATSDDLRVVQQKTSSEILCPLYRTLIDSFTANPIPPNLTPAQAKFRQGAAKTIRDGYRTLGCS